jgi:PAS domain S-box-containing protein
MIISSGLPDGTERRFLPVNLLHGATAAAILIVLYFISLHNYLLFHGLVEISGIAVVFSIFIIIWNTRRVVPDGFFLIIGISFLFIGSIDLVHMLAFRGMAVFPIDSTNISTQLWIAARYFQSITFFIATLFIGKSIPKDRNHDVPVIVTACTTACALLFASIFVWQNFPPCYIEGSGLTQFKIVSEYLIALILIATIIILYLKRKHFDPVVWKFLIAAQAFLILGELAFTSYVDVYGFMNLLGHLFRLLSVYFFYRAIVVIGLTRPYDLLLLKLSMEEHELRERFKELYCLFRISTLMEQPETALSEILKKTVHLIPPAMQFPAIAEARIVVEGQLVQTGPFLETPKVLVREIRVNGSPAGRVEVWYREERPEDYEGPFTRDECDLVNAIAERLGLHIERTRAKDALRESEQRYRTFVQSFRGIAYLSTADWIPVFFHGAVEEITGYTEQDFVAGNPRWDQVVWPDDLAEIQKRDNEKLLTVPGYSVQREYRIIRKDGQVRWLSDFIQNGTDDQGLLLLSGVLTDITERKRAEEALRSANKKLNLLSGITRHDIKNQLLVLSGFLELSKRSLSDAAAMADFIAKEEKAAAAIARQISFTKDYEDLGVKSAVWQDVSALVSSTTHELPMQNIRIDNRCPGLEVFADPLLEKVFYNLIDNSLHYGGEKMTAIRITAEEQGGDLKIIYEDDGDGISADDKKQLFTRGFGRHTGLGLFLSREILSTTGITITENGEPGKGVRFEIMVPAGAWRFTDSGGDRLSA